MSRRTATWLVLLGVIAAGCASNTESAVNELIEQVRLQDPQAMMSYQETQELVESPEALPLWIEALENDPSAEVKEWAARLLGRIGDPQAAPALTEALDGPRKVREAAGASLLQIGEEEAEAAFIEALKNGSRDAQIYCLVELERLGSSDAAPAIADVVRDGDPFAAQTAVNTLGGLDVPTSAEALAGLAADTSLPEDIRRQTISNLGRLSVAEADQHLEQLVALLEEQGEGELAAAARAARRD